MDPIPLKAFTCCRLTFGQRNSKHSNFRNISKLLINSGMLDFSSGNSFGISPTSKPPKVSKMLFHLVQMLSIIYQQRTPVLVATRKVFSPEVVSRRRPHIYCESATLNSHRKSTVSTIDQPTFTNTPVKTRRNSNVMSFNFSRLKCNYVRLYV